MKWFSLRTRRKVLPSEKGFLEFAGREPSPRMRDRLLSFRDLVDADMDWADSRKLRFRWRASAVKVLTLALTAASTVVLGIPAIPNRAALALPMVAVVTLLSGMDAFFAWHGRWILMEETQHRLNRLRDEVDYYLVMTSADDVARDKLDAFFEEQQAIWNDVNRRWSDFRRIDLAGQEATPPTIGPHATSGFPREQV